MVALLCFLGNLCGANHLDVRVGEQVNSSQKLPVRTVTVVIVCDSRSSPRSLVVIGSLWLKGPYAPLDLM